MTFLNKHQILFIGFIEDFSRITLKKLGRSLEEAFSENSVKFFDCRAFSLFKTVPGCRAFRHLALCCKKILVQLITVV